MTKIHALLIAAGESKRMGTPKQLVSWGGQTLIEHQIEILHKANMTVAVVLGANAELILKIIQNLNVQIHYNDHWTKGMGASIACGANGIHANKNSYDGMLIALVDQPLISAAHFQTMRDTFEPGKKQIIVSQSKDGITGPPVLFDAIYLDDLMKLDGDAGAKPIIKKNSEHVVSIPSDGNLEDIDTPEAYQRMLKRANLQS